MQEMTVIINSGKCAWGGCTYCGWGRLSARKKSLRELKEFWDEKVRDIEVGSLERIKIFCSGCFLDEKQINPMFRSYVVKSCEKLGVKSLVVESFPRFIKPENLENMQSNKVHILAGIGLEVGNDISLKVIKKGFTLKEFEESYEILKKFGWGIRAYLLVNAPGCEKIDLKKSVEYAKKYSEEVILINTLPHHAAPIMDMWVSGKWRPLDKKEFFEKVNGLECETDFENFRFIPQFPERMKKKIIGSTEKELLHPHYDVWQDYICRFYEPPKKEILLFVPCSFTKPYTNSPLHKAIRRALGDLIERVHMVAVSSPGVVPIELSGRYPFNYYDWKEWEETPDIKKRYTEVTQKRVENFLRAHSSKYKNIFCYMKPDSESFSAVMGACRKIGIESISCVNLEAYEKVRGERNPLKIEEILSGLKSIFNHIPN